MQKFIRANLVRQGFTVLHWGLAMLPTLLCVALLGMTVRATQLLGKFPQPSINDPYLFGQDDSAYQFWLEFANAFLELTFISWIPWFCLTALTLLFHWRYWSKEESKEIAFYRFLPTSIYILSHLILLFEPTNRLGWLLD